MPVRPEEPVVYRTGSAAIFAIVARAETVTMQGLRLRRDEILLAIEARKVQPTLDVLRELAEINMALGEAEP